MCKFYFLINGYWIQYLHSSDEDQPDMWYKYSGQVKKEKGVSRYYSKKNYLFNEIDVIIDYSF